MKRRSVVFIIVVLVFLTSLPVLGTTWIDETRSVNANDSTGWIIEPNAESTVYISFLVIDGVDISLLVFDHYNYLNWTDGSSSETIIERINTEQDSIAFSAEYSQIYFVILDNKDNLNSVDVEIIVQDSPIESGTTDDTPKIITLIIFGIIITIGILLSIFIWLRKRGKSREEIVSSSTHKTKKLQNEPTKGWFCQNCKNKVVDIEEYCSYCGHRIYRKP